MGLDQYLYAERYTSPAEWRGEESNQTFNKLVEVCGMGDKKLAEFPAATVKFNIGYWRKANAIHQWFVDNCQGGEDDCGEYSVDREKLQELKDLCLEVLANPSKSGELLPTQSGFFFGSTEYDEYYRYDLESTVAIIDNAFSLGSDWYFKYSSSW